MSGKSSTAAYDLGPLPFDPTTGGDTFAAKDWRSVVVATQQAGMSGVLDVVARDLAAHSPGILEDLPLALDQRASQVRQTSRATLSAAQRTNGLGFGESSRQLALLAGETATEKPAAIAAFKLAHRLGGKTEAEHVLFRMAQRSQSSDDALATARRAMASGYPDVAKYAYYRAATTSRTADDALGAAQEASSQGLKYEKDGGGFERWKKRQDDQFVRMEGAGTTSAGSQSPYRALALAKPRYINPYMAAMLKADRADFPRIAAAATRAGETDTANVIESRIARASGTSGSNS